MNQKPGGNQETVFWNRTWVRVAEVRGGDGWEGRQQLEHQAEATTETLVKPLEGRKSWKVFK